MIYIESSVLSRCLVRLPEKYDPIGSYSLIIGLTGGGGNPEDLIALWDRFPGRRFIFAVPQAPYPLLDGGKLGFDWAMWPTGNEELIGQATDLSEKYILKTTEVLSRLYSLDGVYLMGFSQGAILSYLTGIKNSDVYRGIIIMSGPGLLAPLDNPFGRALNPNWLTEEYMKAAGDLRVFITHGRDDRPVPFEMATKSRDILESHGYDVTFRSFDGGHSHPPGEIIAQIANWI